MRILFITPRIPFPPRKGDQLRAFNQLKGLKQLGHDIHLISYSDQPVPVTEISSLCSKFFPVKFNKISAMRSMLAGMTANSPLQVSYYLSEEFRKTIKEAVQTCHYDILHTQLVRTSPYFDELKELPNVIDFVDSISLNLTRRKAFKKSIINPFLTYEAKAIQRMEKKAVQEFDGSIFISHVDKNNVERSSPKVISISNGVDLDYFHYQHQLPANRNLIFVGNMSYEPNRHGVHYFIEHIYPLIKQKITDFTFYVVGREPTKELIQLCKDKKDIIVTGEVDDIREYLHQSRLFICPLKTGAGVQNKVLEAMSAGVPVLTTSIVNDPIGAVDSRSAVVRDSDQDFADAVVNLLSDTEKLEEIRINARAFVEENYHWDSLNKKLEQFYLDTISRRNSEFGKRVING
ncbi:sugar transferase, PEP-CTERM/EpsH1 system associated [Fictibacillus solisalsi]|uniref:Sugar transferase, PEP-CTERM/EpsH1 system associated n=1 Tax=Fictibacillus solisalsi TaxID=459525 RepID=A0A1G9YFH4_9BACL|nr:glycosyltransferase [Fictibacillus solisalsi]SDN07889.1 sugar transferase, PEP-CTERM/EpsH1 system associated [Fictibacillus solisalsi]